MKTNLLRILPVARRKAVGSPYFSLRGFTLIEMLVVLVVLGVLLSMAIPSIREYILDARVSTQGTELVSDLALARSEAVSRAVRVVVCASTDNSTCSGSGDDWRRGRILFIDSNGDGARQNSETLLRIGMPLSETSTMISTFTNDSYVGFMPYGGLFANNGRGTFQICINGFNRGRLVTLEITGRAVVSKLAC